MHEHRTSEVILLSPSEQWSGRGVYIVCKVNHEKDIDTNDGIHLALLQIRVTPLDPGIPSAAMLLFNHPTQGTMPMINRMPMIQITMVTIVKCWSRYK